MQVLEGLLPPARLRTSRPQRHAHGVSNLVDTNLKACARVLIEDDLLSVRPGDLHATKRR
jgi:hypothetical protein